MSTQTAAALSASPMVILEVQRAAFLRDGSPTLARRRAALLQLKQAILARRKEFEDAISADFGHRSAYETAMMELMPTIQGINYMHAQLRKWMRPRRRSVPLHFQPGRAEVLYQPLGIIGIIAPWNYPLGLCLIPLATAIAAGNRAMIKPSEFTPRTSEAMSRMLSEIFTKEEVAVVTGGPDTGAAFAALPFDHLIFTGSTSVGRKVMRAASENVVPLTLELGGKSPVIVDRGFPATRSAKPIAFGKLANAGQTCIAPDYALVHRSDIEDFVNAYQAAFFSSYPKGAGDDAYTGIINAHHYQRLTALVEDARSKGAQVIELDTAQKARSNTIAPTLILNATGEMGVMQQEIFGPILPVVPYDEIGEAVAYVNAHARPLALFLFSDSRATIGRVLSGTTSGNVTVNDTLLHYAVDDLPFGGVGPSGMGAYHGEEGFKSLSHAKGIFTQARWNFSHLARAPFSRITDLLLSYLLR
jgi:coniferyl-aldehyde dehydrogenase